LGLSFFELGGHIWNDLKLRPLLAAVLPDGRKFTGFEIARNFDRIGERTMLLSAQRINQMDLILVVIDDITERKSVEQALRSGEQRLRRVIENEAVGVIFVDDNGLIVDANDKFLQMTGYVRAELEASVLTSQRLTPAEYSGVTGEQLRKLASTGRLGPYEKESFRKDGSRFWMMIAGASLGDGTSVEFCLDVTSRKRAEHALVEGDRRKDEFLATLAHELRNPLAPLTNAVQVLRTSADDEPTRERMYTMMDRQLRHLVRLVDDLLDLARVSRGFIELRTELVDVATVVRTALESTSQRIEAAGRTLAVTLPGSPLIVKADAVRLAQVIVNLLNNASNYTGRNGQIWLDVRRENDHAVIAVRDDGVGIAPEMLPKVFEMFVQVDRSQAGGLGIGLTLAQSLVQLHGGSLEAYSEGLGRGSEFLVRLPLSKDTATKSPDARRGDVDLSNRRVLVVDDNRDAADSLAMMLGVLGAEVKIAYDGADALQIAESFAPDLLLLDIGMPGMDGFEVARQFRGRNRSTECTLVAVTGWGQDADRRRTARAGFNYHLTKPVAIETLLDMLGSRKPPLAIETIETIKVGDPRRHNGDGTA
jgi:PAS domain S-box-containing protein